MRVTREAILSKLPAYQDKWVTVTNTQDVGDIIADIVKSHYIFAPYYDKFAYCFSAGTIEQICDKLCKFCTDNIAYKEENEDIQTTALPTGIIERGHGDCKHYASFIGGCLSAIARETGVPINWSYCFASYKLDQKTPYHVFVVVETPSGTVWCDPTPGAGGKQPVWVVYKKINEKKISAPVRSVGRLSLGAISETLPPAGLTAAQTSYNNNLIQAYLTEAKRTWGGLDPSKKVTILGTGQTVEAFVPIVYDALQYSNALTAATLAQMGFSLNPADGFSGPAAFAWLAQNAPNVNAQLKAMQDANAANEQAAAAAASKQTLNGLFAFATAVIGLGLAASVKPATAAQTATKALTALPGTTNLMAPGVLPGGTPIQTSNFSSLLPWIIGGVIVYFLLSDK